MFDDTPPKSAKYDLSLDRLLTHLRENYRCPVLYLTRGEKEKKNQYLFQDEFLGSQV